MDSRGIHTLRSLLPSTGQSIAQSLACLVMSWLADEVVGPALARLPGGLALALQGP